MRPTSISTVLDYVQTNAESGARNDALNTYLATTDRAIEMGSGERAKYRHSMVVASHQPGSSARASLGFPIAFHILSNFGWIYFAPVATTLMLTRAPAATRGTMAGISMLSVTAGSLISGRLGALYEKVSASDFWLIHAAIVGGAGLAFLLFAKRLAMRLPESVDASPAIELPPATFHGG